MIIICASPRRTTIAAQAPVGAMLFVQYTRRAASRADSASRMLLSSSASEAAVAADMPSSPRISSMQRPSNSWHNIPTQHTAVVLLSAGGTCIIRALVIFKEGALKHQTLKVREEGPCLATVA